MSRRLRVLLLTLLLAFVGACGPEATDAPESEVAPVPPLEPAGEPLSVSRLQLLRQRIRTWVLLGGPEADLAIRQLYEEILELHDPDDLEARRHLGYTDFHADILGRVLEPGDDPVPEAIANRRGYPFLDAVTELGHRRWLLAPEDVELAREAVASMHEHATRLQEDHRYRLGDTIRANIATDASLSGYNYVTAWAPPHLICYASSDRLTDYDLLKVPYRERRTIREKLAHKRRLSQPALEAKARIFSQLYDEFMRRYAERFDLKPLNDVCGGRPDYRLGVRSYPDGVPLVVWVLESEDAFREYHRVYRGWEREFPFDAGYFRPRDGRLYLYVLHRTDEEFPEQTRADIGGGVCQLLYWFIRQRNKWRRPITSQDFFWAGLSNYLSGVRIGEDLKLEFTDLNVDLLEDARELAALYRDKEEPYPFIPLERLVNFDKYKEVYAWGRDARGLEDRKAFGLYIHQSWMLVTFLHEFDDARYRNGFDKFFGAVLSRETGHGKSAAVFQRCLGFDEDEWDDLDEEFQEFVIEDLLKREIR